MRPYTHPASNIWKGLLAFLQERTGGQGGGNRSPLHSSPAATDPGDKSLHSATRLQCESHPPCSSAPTDRPPAPRGSQGVRGEKSRFNTFKISPTLFLPMPGGR
ncbi:uncharacterized protein LOC110211534 isoform X2 [Phascolarctos cinereus]